MESSEDLWHIFRSGPGAAVQSKSLSASSKPTVGMHGVLTDCGGRLHEARSYVRLNPISNDAAAEFSLRIPVSGNFIRPIGEQLSKMFPLGFEGLEELEAS